MNIRPMTIADYDQLHTLWLSTPGMGLNSVIATFVGNLFISSLKYLILLLGFLLI